MGNVSLSAVVGADSCRQTSLRRSHLVNALALGHRWGVEPSRFALDDHWVASALPSRAGRRSSPMTGRRPGRASAAKQLWMIALPRDADRPSRASPGRPDRRSSFRILQPAWAAADDHAGRAASSESRLGRPRGGRVQRIGRVMSGWPARPDAPGADPGTGRSGIALILGALGAGQLDLLPSTCPLGAVDSPWVLAVAAPAPSLQRGERLDLLGRDLAPCEAFAGESCPRAVSELSSPGRPPSVGAGVPLLAGLLLVLAFLVMRCTRRVGRCSDLNLFRVSGSAAAPATVLLTAARPLFGLPCCCYRSTSRSTGGDADP